LSGRVQFRACVPPVLGCVLVLAPLAFPQPSTKSVKKDYALTCGAVFSLHLTKRGTAADVRGLSYCP